MSTGGQGTSDHNGHDVRALEQDHRHAPLLRRGHPGGEPGSAPGAAGQVGQHQEAFRNGYSTGIPLAYLHLYCDIDADSQNDNKLRYQLEKCSVIFTAVSNYPVRTSFGW